MLLRFAGGMLFTAAATVSQAQTPVEAAVTQWEFTAGADYSAGRYGADSDTEVSDARVGAKVQMSRLRLEAALPYVSIGGPGELVGGVPVSAGSTSQIRRSGLGDLSLSAAYRVGAPREHWPTVELGGTLKLPTAKADLGTNRVDYGLLANAYGNLTPMASVFVSAGYSWLGDSATYQLKNGVTAMAALNLAPNAQRNIGLSVAYRGPVASTVGSQLTLTPYLTQRFAKDWGVTLYVLTGLTKASPRAGAGLSISRFR